MFFKIINFSRKLITVNIHIEKYVYVHVRVFPQTAVLRSLTTLHGQDSGSNLYCRLIYELLLVSFNGIAFNVLFK